MTIELIEIAMAVMFVAVWLLAADITFREKPQAGPRSAPQPDQGGREIQGLHIREKLRAARARRPQRTTRTPPGAS